MVRVDFFAVMRFNHHLEVFYNIAQKLFLQVTDKDVHDITSKVMHSSEKHDLGKL